MPLNTVSYFFIFLFEHALESPPALKKKKKSHTITGSVLVDGCDMSFVITATIILR